MGPRLIKLAVERLLLATSHARCWRYSQNRMAAKRIALESIVKKPAPAPAQPATQRTEEQKGADTLVQRLTDVDALAISPKFPKFP